MTPESFSPKTDTIRKIYKTSDLSPAVNGRIAIGLVNQVTGGECSMSEKRVSRRSSVPGSNEYSSQVILYMDDIDRPGLGSKLWRKKITELD